MKKNLSEIIAVLNNHNIGVLYGGLSSERPVSLKSGKAVSEALSSMNIKHKLFDVHADIISILKNDNITLVFNALHGKYGEDGIIQGMLDMVNIKCSGCNAMTSSVTMSKTYTKHIFKANNILTPEYFVLYKNSVIDKSKLFFPNVIKADTEGSSIGLFIVDNESDFDKYVSEAFNYSDVVIIEKFISGREFTAGIIGNNDMINLPFIEIIPKNKYFDYEAKYVKGMTDFIVPADIPYNLTDSIIADTSKIYSVFNCSGMSRIDFIIDDISKKPNYLEINTIPGFTATSLLPQAAKSYGYDFPELIIRILYYSLIK